MRGDVYATPASMPPLPVRTRPMIFQKDHIWRYLIGLGLLWMMLGMVIMPSGASFNPGRSYQISLIVLLYLPSLGFAAAHRWAVWRAMLVLPAFRLFLLLLVWAGVSLLWAPPHHRGDEVARLLSVLTFVLGWQAWAGGDELRRNRLLWIAGLGLALVAAGYGMQYLFDPPDDGRMIGEGVTATANYAAAVMGAACLWLCQLPVRTRQVGVWRWLAVASLLVFVGLTRTRSVWLALALCVVLAPLWDMRPRVRWMAAGIVLLMLVAALMPSSILLDRGASLRPQLFVQSLHLIAQHPWMGLGQGAAFSLVIANETYTHSHNVLTQTMIELGVPGLLLAVSLWLVTAWQGWRHRHEMQGRLLLSMWIYASVVLQFDMPQLLDSPRPSWLLFWLPFAVALGMAWHDRRMPGADSGQLLQQAA